MANPSKLTEADWELIRAQREAGGKTFRQLGEQYGISHTIISRRAKREGWGEGSDFESMIHRRTQEKVAGVTSADPKKVLEAVDEEAGKRAEVRKRHRQEWVQVATLRQEALEVRKVDHKKAFDLLKIAKITAELTAIQQGGEVRAWGLEVPVDVKSMTDEQLEQLAKGRVPK